MKKQFILFSIAILVNFEPLYAKNLIFLTVATSYKVKTSPKNQIWIQNKNILQTKDLGEYLIFNGKAKGSSKVQIGNSTYTFVVGSKSEQEAYQRLKSILRFSPQLSLDYEQGKLLVTGNLQEVSEWKSLRALNLSNWLLQAETSELVCLEIQKLLNQEMNSINSSRVEIYLSPFASVRISKSFAKENSQALDALKMYGLNLITDDDTITTKPLIKVKMTLMEIRKSTLSEIGINPPNKYSAQLSSNGKINNGQWSSDININWLESKGIGQILASPILLTKSGTEAEFFAGGEIPLKFSNNKVREIIWKKYGINLKVKPTADNQGHLKMDIETEVSSIDPKRTIDGIPALISNKIQSHFELQKSQTLVLSGLIKHVNGETITGWPWLSEIPILGALFSSSDFQQEKTEMIILVTPEIMKD